ncbi:hypothetical protein ACFL0V_04230, partial [Nanoarchaeota archaeon]
TELFNLSAGIPIVLKTLCQTYKTHTKKSSISDELTLIRYLFKADLTHKQSPLFNYCRSLFNTSLNNARGSSLIKSLLKILCMHENLKLTEIARLLYRSAPVTKSLLERLIEVDLIEKSGTTFRFTNPVLKEWCKHMFNNIEFEDYPSEKDVEKLGGMA